MNGSMYEARREAARGHLPEDKEAFRRAFSPERALELIEEFERWAGTVGVALTHAGHPEGVGGPAEAAEAIESLAEEGRPKSRDWWTGDPRRD